MIPIHASSTTHHKPGHPSNMPQRRGSHKTARITGLQLMVPSFSSSSMVGYIPSFFRDALSNEPLANGFVFWSHPVPESKGKWWMRLDGGSWTSFNTSFNASDTARITFFNQYQLVGFIPRHRNHAFTTCLTRQPDSDHEFIAWFESGAAGESAFIDMFSYVTPFNTNLEFMLCNGSI